MAGLDVFGATGDNIHGELPHHEVATDQAMEYTVERVIAKKNLE